MKRILTILFVTSLLLSGLIGAGPPVSHWKELAPYTGRNAYQKIDGTLRQKMFLAIYDGLQKSYGGTVEGQLHENVVLLCAETSDFLYSHFTPTTVDYRQGSRPVLEAKVEEVTADLVTEREKVLALLRYVRDIYQNPSDPGLPVMRGGTEEQLLESGPRWCEFQSRLLVALWQVAGFPARRIAHFVGGHAVSEVFFEGKWAYIDIRGIYVLKPDGNFASTWEIWTHPDWIDQQSEEVKADRVREDDPLLGDIYQWDNSVKQYFHPHEVTTIMNYDINQADQYNYRQVKRDPNRVKSPEEIAQRQQVSRWRQRIFAGK